MKDIIASQHVARRTRPSLLAIASESRSSPVIEKQKRKYHRYSPPGCDVLRKPDFFALFFSRFKFSPKAKPEFGRRKRKKDEASPHEPVRLSGASAAVSGENFFRETDLLRNSSRDFFHEAPRETPVKKQKRPVLHTLAQDKSLLISGGVSLAVLLGGLIFYESFIPDPEPPGDTVPLERFIVRADAVEPASDEIPLDIIENFAWREYKVQSGDTVEGIAKQFGLSLDAVIASNNIGNVRRGLIAGDKIRIPNMDGIPYTVKKGDSYEKIAASSNVPLEAVLDANDVQSGEINPGTVLFIPGARMKSEDLRMALGELFIYPVRGRLTSRFGWRMDPFIGTRQYHAGLDISSPQGTAVKAAAGGRISATGYNSVYGNFVIITHNSIYQTMYGHLSRIITARGNYVAQGDIVGTVGNTGRSTGPHLHLAVYKNGRAINPLEILGK
jgi:murein DD-endopeptidase MepM/ murein hydrolase activator NlpD